MFKKFTNGCVRVVNRWLPDPFLFAIILTVVVFIAAMVGTHQGPLAMVKAWGGSSGFWSLLLFSMQMALVLAETDLMPSFSVMFLRWEITVVRLILSSPLLPQY